MRTVKTLLNEQDEYATQLLIRAIIKAGENGVERCHCVSYESDTALLQELFTPDGAGTLIAKDHKELVSTATIDDVVGIMELIQPLEQQGVLVKRSREMLEVEIDKFIVLKKEEMVIACAALYSYPEEHTGELACVVIHPDYRKGNRGDRLIREVKEKPEHKVYLAFLFLPPSAACGFKNRALSNLMSTRYQLRKKSCITFNETLRYWLNTFESVIIRLLTLSVLNLWGEVFSHRLVTLSPYA